MRARAADADGRVDVAAASYAQALAAAPDNPVVAVRAYREAMEAGDDALIDRAAGVLRRAGVAPADAALLALASAAHTHDAAAAERAIATLSQGSLAVLVPSLAGWLAFERGTDPLAPLEGSGKDVVARRFAGENRALLLIASGRTDDGMAALRALLGVDGANFDLRFAAVQLLTGQQHVDLARSLLTGDDPVLAAARARPVGVPPSLAFGASRLFTRIAADLAPGEPTPLSITLTRAALRADPTDDRARLFLAGALSKLGATGHALTVIDSIDPNGPFAGLARTSRVTVLADADDAAAALAAAGAVAARPDASPYDQQRYGDRLLDARRFDEAAAAYRRVIDGGAGDWSSWMQYGGALDQGGHWRQARAALERAVKLAPDEPLALNYLGYAQIDHGEDVAAAALLLERAARLKPDDTSIADSLAWAYFRRGDTARALPMLERAAAGEPGNAIIAEHLGDAYWSAGRRYEARYAWRAASVVADTGDAARLFDKIAHGIDPARR